MSKNNDFSTQYGLLSDDEKFNALLNFHTDLDTNLAKFFLSIFADTGEDSNVRSEAVNILGLYRGCYDDTSIKQQIMAVINAENDDELQVVAINALSNMIASDDDAFIKNMYEIIVGDYYILVKESAFALIIKHKHLDISRWFLVKLFNDKEFGLSAKHELNGAAALS